MKTTMDCPYCNGTASLQKQTRNLTYRKEPFEIVAHYYKCNKCDEEFTTTESDSISLLQAHNQYREKYNIPFPEEIVATREKYGLAAAKMSEVLGLGANGYSNYEKGEMPIPAIANLMNAASQPQIFADLLHHAKDSFSVSAYNKANERIKYLLQNKVAMQNGYAYLYTQSSPNKYSGYKRIAIEKIAGLISFFITHSKADFNDRLKLNKLLFYADFVHYKNHVSSITGLTYRAIQYGPVPANYDAVYAHLESKQLISPQFKKLPNGGAREVFVTNTAFDEQAFLAAELETIRSIQKQFSDTSSWDIVDLSHEEKAWKDLNAEKQLINYQHYAFDLKAV